MHEDSDEGSRSQASAPSLRSIAGPSAPSARQMTSLSSTGIPGPNPQVAAELSQYFGGHSARRIRLAGSITELDDVLHKHRKVHARAAHSVNGTDLHACGDDMLAFAIRT